MMKKTWKSIWLLMVLFSITFVACDDENTPIDPLNPTVKEDSKPSTPKESDRFFVVNEDWFGKDNGTINLFEKDKDGKYTPHYRIYRAANAGEKLGKTTQYGVHWGDNLYLISKQGTRVVVANAETLKKVATIEEIGGDGRAFVGVSESKGYVSHDKGIAIMDLKENKITGQVAGVSAQVGNMIYSHGRLFAPVQGAGFAIISVEKDELEKTIEGNYKTALAQTKDGTIWAANETDLVAINPQTLTHEVVKLPEAAKIADTWGSFNRTSFVASTKEDALYWGMTEGWNPVVEIFKFDVKSKTGKVHIKFGNSPEGKALALYSGGLAVEPVSGNLITTLLQTGWDVNSAYNWNNIYDHTGKLVASVEVLGDNETANAPNGGYYWFPAMPLVPDVNIPEILLNQIIVKKGETVTKDLSALVIDHDNIPAQITVTVETPETKLFTTTLDEKTLSITAGNELGVSDITIIAQANGKTTTKKVEVVVTQ